MHFSNFLYFVYLSKCVQRMRNRRKSTWSEKEPDSFWWMKVSEEVCKHDWHNVRLYLFFNMYKFRTQCAETLRLCHISIEKSGTTPGGMKTISFQQVMSAPKTCPIVYKTCIILRASLRNPAIEWWQSAMNLITLVSRERARAYYSVWHHICKFTHLVNIIFSVLQLAKSNIISTNVDNDITVFTFSISQPF